MSNRQRQRSRSRNRRQRELRVQNENQWEHVLRGKLESICLAHPGVTVDLLEVTPSRLPVDLRKQIKTEWQTYLDTIRRSEAYRDIPADFVETLCERFFKALKCDQFQEGGSAKRTKKKLYTRRRKE